MITKTERPFLVHAIAFCDNCGFSEEDYKKAVQKGREHAHSTGHSVTVETGYVKRFNYAE